MTPYERDVLEEIAEPGSVKGLRAGAAIMVVLNAKRMIDQVFT